MVTTSEIRPALTTHQTQFFRLLPSEPTIKKTNLVLKTVFNYSVIGMNKVYHVIRKNIGVPLRDHFYFPLSLIKNSHSEFAKQMQYEDEYSRDFFDKTKPLDLNFPLQDKVREHFATREQTFHITNEKQEKIAFNCRIIESKSLGMEPAKYNFLYAPGNLVTINNSAVSIYPFLAAYLKNGGENPPPARFIIISENNMKKGEVPYRPHTIDEAGLLFHRIFIAIKNIYGPVNQLVAHSLGCIFAASSLKHFNETEIPKNICLDRGPTSTWEASKKRLLGMGWCTAYPLAKFSGWSINLEEELVTFCKNNSKPSFLLLGVEQDHHFPHKANLCLGEQISKLQLEGRVKVLYFAPPMGLFHENAHHSLRSDYLHAQYLKKNFNREYLDQKTNVAEAIVNKSLT